MTVDTYDGDGDVTPRTRSVDHVLGLFSAAVEVTHKMVVTIYSIAIGFMIAWCFACSWLVVTWMGTNPSRPIARFSLATVLPQEKSCVDYHGSQACITRAQVEEMLQESLPPEKRSQIHVSDPVSQVEWRMSNMVVIGGFVFGFMRLIAKRGGA